MADDNTRNSVLNSLMIGKDFSTPVMEVKKQTPPTTLYKQTHESIVEKSDTSEKDLIEELSDYTHSSWSGWMTYLFSKSKLNRDGTVTISKDLVDRWTKQIDTPYEDLSEEEKKSDREEAQKMLKIVKANNHILETNSSHEIVGVQNESTDTGINLSEAFDKVVELKTSEVVQNIDEVRDSFMLNIDTSLIEDIMK